MIIKLFCYRYWLDLIDGLCSLFYFALAYVLIISLYCEVLQVIWLMRFSWIAHFEDDPWGIVNKSVGFSISHVSLNC